MTKLVKFKCSYDGCDKTFTSRTNLARHGYIHDPSARVFRCDLCPKSFGRKDKLNEHIRHHTEERPHSCNHCGKKFRFKQSLTSHTKQCCKNGSRNIISSAKENANHEMAFRPIINNVNAKATAASKKTTVSLRSHSIRNTVQKAQKVDVSSKIVALGKKCLRKKVPNKKYTAETTEEDIKAEIEQKCEQGKVKNAKQVIAKQQDESDSVYEEVTLLCKFFGLC